MKYELRQTKERKKHQGQNGILKQEGTKNRYVVKMGRDVVLHWLKSKIIHDNVVRDTTTRLCGWTKALTIILAEVTQKKGDSESIRLTEELTKRTQDLVLQIDRCDKLTDMINSDHGTVVDLIDNMLNTVNLPIMTSDELLDMTKSRNVESE